MDINNQQQTTSFLKGMNTDISDALLQDGQYRYAENVQVLTDTDSNTGELHIIEGTTDLKTFDGYKILAMTSIRDYVIVIAKNSEYVVIFAKKGTDDFSIIYRFSVNDTTTAQEELFGKYKLSLVTRYETPNDIKLYIADGIHSILELNVAKYYENYHADGYGAVGSVDELTGYQSTMLDVPAVEDRDGGTIPAGRLQYAYRFYAKTGTATKLSPVSKPLSLYTSTGGYSQNATTNKAVDITIPYYSKLECVQIFRINYIQNGQSPAITKIYDSEQKTARTLIGQSMPDTYQVYTDFGDSKYSTLSVAEFLSMLQVKIQPKVIESKQDYLFAANIKYEQDDVDELFKNVDESWFTVSKVIKEYAIVPNANGDTRNPLSERVPSLHRKEKYRYGFIIHDRYGRSTSVKWLADVSIDPMQADGWQLVNIDTTNNITTARAVGINIKLNSNVEEDYADIYNKISKIEIVRCLRGVENRRVLFQGIVSKTLQLYSGTSTSNTPEETSLLCPSGIMTMQNIMLDNGSENTYADRKISKSNSKIIQFASPEVVYQQDDVQNILSTYKDDIKLSLQAAYTINKTTQSHNYTYIKIDDGGSNKQNMPFLWRSGVQEDGFLKVYNGTNGGGDNPWAPSTNSWECRMYGSYRKTNNELEEYFNINHAIPVSIHSAFAAATESPTINSVKFPKVPMWSDFAKDGVIRFQDDVTSIGTYTFINWAFPLALDQPTGISSQMAGAFKNNWVTTGWSDYQRRTFSGYISTGGKCALLALDSNILPATTSGTATGGDLSAMIANIEKTPTDYPDKKDSVYYSFGNIFSPDQLSSGRNVFDGDTWVELFTYNAAHAWYDPTYRGGMIKMASVYEIPLESDIDIRAQYGYLFDSDTNNGFYIQDEACVIPDGYSQDKDAYWYNTAYNAQPTLIPYTPSTTEDYQSSLFDTRVHFSNVKTNGEAIDSWLQFQSANFLDVDSRYGAITDLRLFKNTLMFWQQHATGMLSVNERSIVQDNTDVNIILGSGGVLDRYDYITTVYGMKEDQYAETQSNGALYWWDHYAKEMLQYSQQGGLIQLAAAKGLKNFINQKEQEENPLLFYDDKYKQVVFNVLNEKLSLAFNESSQAFTSAYTFDPHFSITAERKVILGANTEEDGKLYNWNSAENNEVTLFDTPAYPKLQYVVNPNAQFVKTFDIMTFGGRFYGGDENLSKLKFTFNTPLKQHAETDGTQVTNREYDFRLAIPRDGENVLYGNRLRGKTMQCEFESTSNSIDFSLQYITTKYRISWS